VRRQSQKSKLLEYLESGKTVTTASAVDLWKCYRVSERVRELESEGHIIEHKREISSGGAQIVRYRLMESKPKTQVQDPPADGELFPNKMSDPLVEADWQ